MSDESPRRLTLLYQLYLASQASRRFMRSALAGTDMTGEEYALYSYLYGNGASHAHPSVPRLRPAHHHPGHAARPVDRGGDITRLPHPTDKRARLLQLTDAGRSRLEAAIPDFTVAYRALLGQLEEQEVDDEAVFAALETLRSSIIRTADLLEAEQRSD